MADDGEVTLICSSGQISGWTEVEVQRGIEIMPSNFNVALTEKYPGAADFAVQPGDTCQVKIGADTVITGYVDRYNPRIEGGNHTVRVIGRSKSADLVDCSAEWPNGQISGSSCLQIATKLAQPYGITVKGLVDTGAQIPQFNLTLGESPYAIIERIARYRGLLFYDDTDGTCLLNQAGSGKHSSGVVEGQNIELGDALYAMDERFSTYVAYLQSVDTMTDLGDGGNLLSTVPDPGVKRHRQLDLIAEAGGGGLDVAKQRAIWECARRAGRANKLTITLDSWRDSGGKLWTPNFLIPVAAPTLKVPAYDWTIGQVTFRRDASGTHADLVIMPKAAFLPEPILLQPFPPDVPPGAPQQ